MKKLWTIMGGIGFMMMMLGVASMDSECILIPLVLVIAGQVMCYASARVICAEER